MQNLNPKTNQPWKILWFGDLVAPSGFGRIGNEVLRRLAQRGYSVQAAALNYTGWPHDFPFHVWPLAGQDTWNSLVMIANTTKPDLLVSCQDFPYHQTIWNACRIDFSRVKWVWITPIDGTPIHPDWLKMADYADGGMVISRFGVEALRQAGKRAALCHPGVNLQEFYPADDDEKKVLREKAGYGAGDYVVGIVCMNQGRKAIPPMLEAFHEFSRDKPEARLFLDMDKVSPAGWDIPNLLRQMGWTEIEQKRVDYRPDLFERTTDPASGQSPFHPLRARYALMDAHMVISHREGFGLPLVESMACRVPTLALDWCSGPEIVGEERGLLVKRLAYMEYGTWGGARDAFPDMPDLIEKLETLYANRTLAAHVAERGYEWAVRQTWDVTTDQVESVVQSALKRERKDKPSHEPIPAPTPDARQLSDTRGPASRPGDGREPEIVGRDPGLQRSEESHPVPEIAGGDGERGGDGRADGNPGAG